MSHFLIRSALKKDIKGLLKLAQTFPLYNLPNDKKILSQKMEESEKSFQKTLPPFKRNYIFILEDLKTDQVIGSSQILSFWTKKQSYCYLLKKQKNSAYLKLLSREKKRHQLGGLIVDTKHRGSKLGLLLTLSRFLFLKIHDKDFSKRIEVSLTGLSQKKENLFWAETGAQWVKKNYLEALALYRKDPHFFLKKFPKELKIPLTTLSQTARSSLEKVHPQTLPAYKGLLKRGFNPTGYHHLLDGGLYLEAKTSSLLKKIESLSIKFEKSQKSSVFLISKKKPESFSKQNPFFVLQVKGEKRGEQLSIDKNPFFKEGEKVFSLALS